MDSRVIDPRFNADWNLFKRLLDRSGSFAELGTDSGIHSLFAAAVSSGSQVQLFVEEESELLLRNINQSGLAQRIDVVRCHMDGSGSSHLPNPGFGPEYSTVREEAGESEKLPEILDPDLFNTGRHAGEFELIRTSAKGNVIERLKSIHRSLHDARPVIWLDGCRTDLGFEVEELLSFYGYEGFSLANGRLLRSRGLTHRDRVSTFIYVNTKNRNALSSFARSLAQEDQGKRDQKNVTRENGLLVGSTVNYR